MALHHLTRWMPARLLAVADRLRGQAGGEGAGERLATGRMALSAFAVRVVGAGIAYLSQILLARVMGDFEYGIFAVVWVWVTLGAALTNLGFSTSVIRFIPEYRLRDEIGHVRGVLVGSRLLGVVLATVIAGAGALGVWALRDVVSSYYVLPFVLAAACLPLFVLTDIQDGIARAFDWRQLALQPTYIWRPLLIIVFMVGASLAGAPSTAVTACLSAIAATWLTAVAQLLIVGRRMRTIVPAGARAFDFRFWLRISFPIFLVDAFFALLTGSDVLVVAQFLPPDQVAIYFAASKTLAIVHFVFFAVRTTTASEFSKYYHTGNDEALVRLVRDAVRLSFWPSLAVGVMVLAAGHYLLLLFGPAFVSGIGALAILVVGIVARSSVGPMETLLTMTGEQKWCAAVFATAFFANLAMSVLLIPRFGLYGAALSTSLAMMLEAFLAALVAYHRLGLKVFVFSPGGIGRARPRQERATT